MDHRLRAGMQALASNYEMDAAGLEARLQAFGSGQVFSAVQASSTADRDAVAASNSWRAAVAVPGTSPKDLEKARRAADAARKAADDADDAVIEQIRRELHGNVGEPLGTKANSTVPFLFRQTPISSDKRREPTSNEIAAQAA